MDQLLFIPLVAVAALCGALLGLALGFYTVSLFLRVQRRLRWRAVLREATRERSQYNPPPPWVWK